MARINLVKQGDVTTVDIHESDVDGSIFDEYGDVLFRAVKDSTGTVRLIFYRGAEVPLSSEDYQFFLTNLMALMPNPND